MSHVMIIDKDPEQALKLQRTLMELRKGIAFIVFYKVEDAIEYLKNSKTVIDMFFLEAELPDINGFEFAEMIRAEKRYLLTPIIFVTESKADPLEIYQKFHCYSFIKKPFTDEVIRQQLQTLFSMTSTPIHNDPDNGEKIITLETIDTVVSISAEDIVSLEVYGNNCTVYTKERNYVLKRGSLENKLKEIGLSSIVRCHKSYGINVQYLEGLKKKERNIWEPIYCNAATAPCLISRTYYSIVKAAQMQFRHSDKVAEKQR